jgi:hypothetical protein
VSIIFGYKSPKISENRVVAVLGIFSKLISFFGGVPVTVGKLTGKRQNQLVFPPNVFQLSWGMGMGVGDGYIYDSLFLYDTLFLYDSLCYFMIT